VVYPAFPDDAKGLLMAAVDDPNPVIFFEHKALYRSISGNVPDDDYYVEIGKAKGCARRHPGQYHHLTAGRTLGY
jgi:2-oxoisovalerate dehydrogenase E1 component